MWGRLLKKMEVPVTNVAEFIYFYQLLWQILQTTYITNLVFLLL